MKTAGPVRELTVDERALWAACPVCHAKHGERCDSSVGLVLGGMLNDGKPSAGVHLARLSAAPKHVQEVPAKPAERIRT